MEKMLTNEQLDKLQRMFEGLSTEDGKDYVVDAIVAASDGTIGTLIEMGRTLLKVKVVVEKLDSVMAK